MATDKTYNPSHPSLFYVRYNNEGQYNSFLCAKKYFAAGEIIVHLEGLTKGPRKYSSVQCGAGEDDHVELNSDLLYVNHSCEPNILFDLRSLNASEWHVRATRDIKADEPLTFFYPSTEWKMDQPFPCQCGSAQCLRQIDGACTLARDEIERRGFLSPWIDSLLRARDDRLRGGAGYASAA